MRFTQNQILIAIALLAISIFAFILRIIPFLYNGNVDVLNLVSMDDPMYNLRQLEVVLHNSGNFPWYDPMTLMPTGMLPHWGPLFIYILAAACVITGASTLQSVITTSLFIPPLMGALLIPVTYLLVKKAFDWKTGMISALFIATIGGQFFARAMYGYLDHHIAEVLFGAIYCLTYIHAIVKTRDIKINFGDVSTLKTPVLCGVLSGIAYFAGFLTMPTMILFAFITLIYVVLMFLIGIKYNINKEALLITNVITFIIPIIGFFAMGYPIVDWIQVSHYSTGQIVAWLGIITVTVVAYIISKYTDVFVKKVEELISPILIVGAVGFLSFLLFQKYAYEIFRQSILEDALEFFMQSSVISTVQEARAWSGVDAWNAFNFFLLLMVVGLAVLAHEIFTKKRGEHIFIYLWTIIMLISTIQHIRYEYYMAINIAIMASIGVGYFTKNIDFTFITSKFNIATKKISKLDDTPTQEAPDKKQKPKSQKRKVESAKKSNDTSKYLNFIGLCMLVSLSAFAMFGGVTFGLAIGQSASIRLNQDWKESLVWLGQNTPDTGVDYYKVYDIKTFSYPNTAYGVMSWWDYGHMITFISHRIPNANPFQAGVYGNYSSSSFFMAPNEEKANEILDNLKTKYIVTDTEMATGKFWAMATWYNPQEGQEPYIKTLFVPTSQFSQTYEAAPVYTLEFYNTMITRLHIYDGNSFNVQNALYIEYETATNKILSVDQLSLRDAMIKSLSLKDSVIKSKSQVIGSPHPAQPIGVQNALQHYRLVHESQSSTITGNGVDVKYVKVFEYVKGYKYRPKIEGILFAEQKITTNTGRSFIYRQEITSGVFIFPYSGTYVIKDLSGNEVGSVSVIEEDIVNGNQSYIDPVPETCTSCSGSENTQQE
jgi:dolichyl-phosphooligosaccharide-protein glycotransferase